MADSGGCDFHANFVWAELIELDFTNDKVRLGAVVMAARVFMLLPFSDLRETGENQPSRRDIVSGWRG